VEDFWDMDDDWIVEIPKDIPAYYVLTQIIEC